MPVSARPILVAQISDLHIKRPGELAYGLVDTAAPGGGFVRAVLEARSAQERLVLTEA